MTRWALLVGIVLLAVGAGVAAGLVVAVLEHPRYRAEASLVVERGTQPVTGSPGLVLTIRDLAQSASVAQAVIRNLALKESTETFAHDVRVTVDGGSAVLKIRADAGRRDRAKAIAQELGLVVTETVHQRFGQAVVGGEPVQAALLDEAHTLPGRITPNLRRNLGWGALFGLVAGLLAANTVAVRWPSKLAAQAPQVLGEVGSGKGFDRVASALLARAKNHPFQTVALAGDGDGHVGIGLAKALGDRGEKAAWALAGDTDASGIEGLAARNAYVLVSTSEFDAALAAHTDAVVAVVPASDPVASLELLVGVQGVPLLGVVVLTHEREAS